MENNLNIYIHIYIRNEREELTTNITKYEGS